MFFVANGRKLTMNGVANRRYNESSFLGIGIRSDIDVTNPVILPTVDRIEFRSVSYGYDFCAAISASGQVYTWSAGRCVRYPGRMTHGRPGYHTHRKDMVSVSVTTTMSFRIES